MTPKAEFFIILIACVGLPQLLMLNLGVWQILSEIKKRSREL